MTNAIDTISQLEGRLPKVIDASTHGIIDYAHATFFFSMAFVCRKTNRPAALAALLTGSFVLTESLLTDYPLGASPVIPFAMHGKLDLGFAALSYFIPKLFGFEETKAALVFKANTFIEAGAVGLTDFDSRKAHGQRS